MTGKTEKSYDEVFMRIKQEVPEFHSLGVHTDFGMALRYSFQKAFPYAFNAGCHFHYCQALYLVVRKLDLETDFKFAERPGYSWSKRFFAMPFLPASL